MGKEEVGKKEKGVGVTFDDENSTLGILKRKKKLKECVCLEICVCVNRIFLIPFTYVGTWPKIM